MNADISSRRRTMVVDGPTTGHRRPRRLTRQNVVGGRDVELIVRKRRFRRPVGSIMNRRGNGTPEEKNSGYAILIGAHKWHPPNQTFAHPRNACPDEG